MGDDDDVSPEQAFQESLDEEVQYMPHSRTQRMSGDGIEAGRLLVWVVPREVVTSVHGTVGSVEAAREAAEYVVVQNWLTEMARRSSCTIAIETLYSNVCADVDATDVVAWRLWVVVPHDQYIRFAQNCQAHLTGKPLPSEEGDAQPEEPAARRPGRPRKRRRTETEANTDRPRASTPRGSWRHVANEHWLLGTLRKHALGADDDDVFALDWDSIVSEATGADADGCNIYSLFDARSHFASPRWSEWYSAKRVPTWQGDLRSYSDDGVFRPADHVYSHYDWALRVVDAHCTCLRPDAEALLNYLMPNEDVPLRLLRSKFSQLAKFRGLGTSARFDFLSDAETLSMIDPGGSHRHYTRSVIITAAHPLRRLAGTLYSEQWKAKLYPVQYMIECENRSKKIMIGKLHADGRVGADEARRVHEQLSDNVSSMLAGHTLGTVPYWHVVATDRQKLLLELNSGSDVAVCATKLLYYRDIASAGASTGRALDNDIYSVLDMITNHMGVTPQQLRVVAKFLFSICASARHQFGPQWAQALFGQSDVGKSYCMKIITCLLSPSMQEEENDASDKAWVLDGKIPFRFVWMDEIGVGLSEASKGRSRDSKTLQAGLSNGVQTYKQYKRGTDGKQDKLQVYNIDCRKNLAITSNKCLN
ncbi:MAG: hypothetical protein VW491_06515, partial [Gammaproteobacteria bacterium]